MSDLSAAVARSQAERLATRVERASKIDALLGRKPDHMGRLTVAAPAVAPDTPPVVEPPTVPGRPAPNPLQGAPDSGPVDERTSKAARLLELNAAMNSQINRQPIL